MKGRDALKEMLAAGKPKETDMVLPPTRPSGAVKAMNLGLQRLSDEASAARALRATLAAAEQIIEIDPTEIDVSFIRDRLPIEADPSIESLKEKISAQGQQVPILVRPHPDGSNRYQAAYGHRRLRAAAELGRSVKAIVRSLSDDELVIAQGQENSERRDLSFIERALFASSLEERKFDRNTITAALGIDKPELSRLLSVVSAIDREVIFAIGPAPKIGRPRWLALAEKIGDAATSEVVKRTIVLEAFGLADSNARFGKVLDAVREYAPRVDRVKEPVETSTGKRVAWIERTRKCVRLVSEETAFGSFLEAQLPVLLRQFEEEQDAENGRSSLEKNGEDQHGIVR